MNMCAKFHQNPLKTVTCRPDWQTDIQTSWQTDIPRKKKFPISSNRRLRSLSQKIRTDVTLNFRFSSMMIILIILQNHSMIALFRLTSTFIQNYHMNESMIHMANIFIRTPFLTLAVRIIIMLGVHSVFYAFLCFLKIKQLPHGPMWPKQKF